MRTTHTAILTDGKIQLQTRFDSKRFFNDGDYLTYSVSGDAVDRQFIARFKHSRANRAGFKSFLIKNFTVEEYFTARDTGMAPATILETKGYVSKTVCKILAEAGYPQTREGFKAYIDAQVAKTVALAQSKGHVVVS